MEQVECSETSAYKIQIPGNYPEEIIQRSEHEKCLKSRNEFIFEFSKFCPLICDVLNKLSVILLLTWKWRQDAPKFCLGGLSLRNYSEDFVIGQMYDIYCILRNKFLRSGCRAVCLTFRHRASST